MQHYSSYLAMRRMVLGSVTCAVAVMLTSNGSTLATPSREITIPKEAAAGTKLGPGIRYMQTEEYAKETQKILDGAKSYASKFIGDPKAAVVLDLDETLLDNSPEYLANELDPATDDWKEWNDKVELSWNSWCCSGKAPAIKQTLDFVRWCNKNSIAVFFISGRDEFMARGTEANLKDLKIEYVALFLESAKSKPEKRTDQKTTHRIEIEKKGFHIICNIGDQESDLYGLHADECFKLPNKAYFSD